MSEIPDIEVARYALRTFNVREGRLMPVAMLVDAWKGGVCEAECVPNPWTMSYTYSALGALAALMGDDVPVPDRNHDAPAEGCHCGIYGCLTIERLRRQYPLECMDIVTVIAVEGKTIIGEIGLRTQAARIVAYWSPVKSVRKICADTCQGAKWFASLDDMLTAYRFEPDRQTEWPPLMASFLTPPPSRPRITRTGRILFWANIACIVVNLAFFIAGFFTSAEMNQQLVNLGAAALCAGSVLVGRRGRRKGDPA